jgi:small-conductance mechanosensitive channel
LEPTDLWNDPNVRRNLIASALVVATALGIRAIARQAIDRAKVDSEQLRLRWMVVARNTSLGVALLGLVFIWASEIQSFAISVVALSAAFVLATKELILCVSGSVLRAGSGAFSIGDRIEMGAVRGDVIDISLLSTTLLEVGPGHQRTGRSITVPNSLLLSGAVVNETFMDEYVLHIVQVPVRADADWEHAERALLEAGREASAKYLEAARRFMSAQSKRHGLPQTTVDPRVHLAMTEKQGELHLLLRVPAPVRERSRIDQAILRGYLKNLRAEQASAAAAD